MIKKEEKIGYFSAALQNFPKQLWKIMGNFRFCDFATMRRLWKIGEKTGRSRLIAHFSSNFWSKIGWVGRKYTNLVNFRKKACVFYCVSARFNK